MNCFCVLRATITVSLSVSSVAAAVCPDVRHSLLRQPRLPRRTRYVCEQRSHPFLHTFQGCWFIYACNSVENPLELQSSDFIIIMDVFSKRRSPGKTPAQMCHYV